MDYGYKPTTHGLAAMAACMALEQPLEITRVAFGGGQIGDGVKLADVHQLVDFVADGTVTDRRHEGEKLCFTVQYANNQHPDVPTFFLSEFMVYIRNPVTGEETDLLYATLGDYRQPVPAYSDGMAPSIWSLPLVLVLSSELEVKVSTPAGLVTWDDVEMLEGALSESIGPLSGSGPPSNETAGRPGQHYLDTETGTEYTCTGVTEEGCRWERSGAASAEEITVGGEKLSQVLEELRPITGAGAPSGGTEGAAGQKYLDTDTGNEFVCTGKDAEGYQWKPVNAGMTEQLIQAHDSDPNAHASLMAKMQSMMAAAGAAISTAVLAIPAGGWVENDSEKYPYRNDVECETAEETQLPFVTIDEDSEDVAFVCGLRMLAETMDGYVRFYARAIPTEDITCTVDLVSQGGSVDVSGSYVLPAASATMLGGVKVGSGLTVASDGTLSIDAANSDETGSLFGEE